MGFTPFTYLHKNSLLLLLFSLTERDGDGRSNKNEKAAGEHVHTLYHHPESLLLPLAV